MLIFKKIKGVIEREKQKHPNKFWLVLLIKRMLAVTVRNLRHIVTKDSTFRSEDDMFMCSLFPKKVLDIIIANIHPKSILDVGCGTGTSLNYFIEHNIDTIGIENSQIAIKKSKYPGKIQKFNLKKEVNLRRQFDLVWCFEVAEHIHPSFESNFLQTITTHAPMIVMSAAKPGQTGHGHFNEQPQEYWIEKLNKAGFLYDPVFSLQLQETGDNHADNLMVFKHKA